MKKTAWVLAAVLFACSAVWAGDNGMDPETARKLGVIEGALDELNRGPTNDHPESRSFRGGTLNQAFVALTGEAVNPLFGVTALGMYNYFRTPEALRDSLPLYDKPEVWAPLLCIILLMLFNSTICEAMPFLKVPLNALGDIVNKAGAVAVLPLVVKMFADAMAHPAAVGMTRVAGAFFPVAYAGEAAAIDSVWMGLGWLAAAVVGAAVYLAVWMTFNIVDVLILLCPFPGVDAVLKTFRLSVIGALAGLQQTSPTLALVLAVVVTLVSFLFAGWSFRLSVFGLVSSTDILFFRRAAVAGDSVAAFSSSGLCSQRVKMRTYGRLEINGMGELVFSFRPWLVLPRKAVVLGMPNAFAAGRGLVNPLVMGGENDKTAWLRLPPRYRGQEAELASRFGLRNPVDVGVAGTVRGWLATV